jgi:hypothetical protein
MSNKRRIVLSEVKRLIQEEGYSRKKIQEHYGLNNKEMKVLFQNPKLKSLRAGKQSVNFILVDDTEEQPTGSNIDLSTQERD